MPSSILLFPSPEVATQIILRIAFQSSFLFYFLSINTSDRQYYFVQCFFFIAGVIVNIFYSLFFCRTHYFFNSIISREKENWCIDFNHFMLLQPTNLQYFYLSTDCPFVVSSLFSTENNIAAYIFTFMELLP